MVTADSDQARAALSSGQPVVLIVAEAGLPAPFSPQPGRFALLVGDPANPGSWTAATAMEAELRLRTL
jgi:hypothetical protein